jgi:hypothetical protein
MDPKDVDSPNLPKPSKVQWKLSEALDLTATHTAAAPRAETWTSHVRWSKDMCAPVEWLAHWRAVDCL